MRTPPPEGHTRCQQCAQDFSIGSGAPSLRKKGVTLTTACSVACRDKLNVNHKKYMQTDKGQAARVRKRSTETGKATAKRTTDALIERRRTDSKEYLKYRLGHAARMIWTGRCYVNKCTLLAENTQFQSPLDLRNLLYMRAHAVGIALGEGIIMHHVIPQEWYDYENPTDVRNCWHPNNLSIQKPSETRHWHLDPNRLVNYPAELFPSAYPKDVLFAAARQDQGRKLHSELVLARQ